MMTPIKQPVVTTPLSFQDDNNIPDFHHMETMGTKMNSIATVYSEEINNHITVPVRVVNTLRPRQNGRNFTDDIFKYIFLNENVWIPVKISLKFVPKGPINNIPALV